MRGATASAIPRSASSLFQSTLPMRGATPSFQGKQSSNLFQSTLPMRGATTAIPSFCAPGFISIHAPHAGSDPQPLYYADRRLISIHAPHAGSDIDTGEKRGCPAAFQSTLPMRGATSCVISAQTSGSYFNPRSPCGERRDAADTSMLAVKISIHAPHAGSDAEIALLNASCKNFNPRSPCGERRALRHRRIRLWLFQSTLPMRGATTTAN